MPPDSEYDMLCDVPDVPGLAFRHFRGETDYQHIAAIAAATRAADGIEWPTSVEDVARQYRHLVNCDPFRDAFFAEMDGTPIGYARVNWFRLLNGTYMARHFANLAPEWRGTSIRAAMLHASERQLAANLSALPQDGPRVYQSWAEAGEVDWENLLKAEGYQPARYFYSMVRPNMDDIPDLPLPDGIEVRPATPEQYPAIWQGMEEAFRDHWGAEEPQEEWFKSWTDSPYFQPAIWQVAWDGDQVVGQVLNFINERENAEQGRKRGYTEDISVRRPWRRRGIARALIAQSLRVLKGVGMEQAALGVDVENPSGALRLYESLGYEPVKREICYEKPFS